MTRPQITTSNTGITLKTADGNESFVSFADSNKQYGDNFKMLSNPNTGKSIAVGNDFFNQYGQDLSDVAGFVPGALKQGSELVDTITQQNNSGIVSGTDTNRDTRTSEVSSFLKDLQTKAATLTGGFSDAESKSEIEAARESARLAYQGMVDDAVENRRVTLPSKIVRAGQRGGFENTQQSGIAALQATEGKEGESFVGAGGKLDSARQDLDRAVVAAKNAQLQAMAQAEAAAKKAITSRRRDDYTVAKDLYDVALEAQKYADEVERDQRDFEENVRQFEVQDKRATEAFEMEKTKFAQENEDRIAEALASTLLDVDESGNIVMPSYDDIAQLAESHQIPVDILNQYINDRVDEINAETREERRAKLSELQFEEQKKQNAISNEIARMNAGLRASELALSRERFKKEQEDEDTTISSTLNDTAKELADLRDSGKLTDFVYNQNINSLMELFGLKEEDRGTIESEINNIMAGGSLSIENIADTVMSGFIGEDVTPTSDEALTKLGDLDEAIWNVLSEEEKKKLVPRDLVKADWPEIQKYITVFKK